MKKVDASALLAATVMSGAVSLLMLFSASLTAGNAPVASCLFLLVASVMTWIPAREWHGLLAAGIEYAVVSAAALLICGSSVFTLLYIAFFGHYALIKLLLDRFADAFLRVILKLLCFNMLAAISLVLCEFAFGYDILTFVPTLPMWVLVPAIELFFLVYDPIYSLLCRLFDTHLRQKLLPRR